MTTRPLLDHIECWVPSEGMDSLNIYPDLAGPGSSTYVRTEDHLADRAALLAEIERLEGMVPKWVEEQSPDEARLSAKGWLEVSRENPTGICFWLMVPPIPLPEKGSE